MAGCDHPARLMVVGDVLQSLPHAPGVRGGVVALQLQPVLSLGLSDRSTQVISGPFVVLSVA